jgi:F1F0 ATPase subunit 2
MSKPTTMTDAGDLIAAALAGAVLGTIFFGGLFWSVRKVMTTRHPATWTFASLTLRVGFVLAGFYVVGHDDWSRWAACTAGFVLTRLVATQMAIRDRAPRQPAETGDASES